MKIRRLLLLILNVMSGVNGNIHRKKKTKNLQYLSPFPVPIKSITKLPTADHFWNYFEGKLNNEKKHIDIQYNGDAKMLQTMVRNLTCPCLITINCFITLSCLWIQHLPFLFLGLLWRK